MIPIARRTNRAHEGLECGKDGELIMMQAEDYHWHLTYEDGQLATPYHARCKPLFSGALQEYAPTIDRIQARLRELASETPVSTTFDSEAMGQKFFVDFPVGRLTLVIARSAFETHSEAKLPTLVGEIPLDPGGRRVLTDSSE